MSEKLLSVLKHIPQVSIPFGEEKMAGTYYNQIVCLLISLNVEHISLGVLLISYYRNLPVITVYLFIGMNCDFVIL